MSLNLSRLFSLPLLLVVYGLLGGCVKPPCGARGRHQPGRRAESRNRNHTHLHRARAADGRRAAAVECAGSELSELRVPHLRRHREQQFHLPHPNRMVSPQDIQRLNTDGYPTLDVSTIRQPHPLGTTGFVRPDFVRPDRISSGASRAMPRTRAAICTGWRCRLCSCRRTFRPARSPRTSSRSSPPIWPPPSRRLIPRPTCPGTSKGSTVSTRWCSTTTAEY